MVQGKINRGRHTDHTAGRHSIRTNQCLPLPSLHIFYRPDALPAAQPTASKHWRQLAHSDYGEDARVLLNGVTCTIFVPYWYVSVSDGFIEDFNWLPLVGGGNVFTPVICLLPEWRWELWADFHEIWGVSRSCAFHLRPHLIRVPWDHLTQHSKLDLNRFSHFYTVRCRESLYFTTCVKTQLTRNLRN